MLGDYPKARKRLWRRDGREIHGEAIALAAGVAPSLKRVSALPMFSFSNLFGNPPKDGALTPPWPELVIAVGRQGLRWARWVRKQSGGKTFLAVLQKPAFPFHGADFIWAPSHDRLRGKKRRLKPVLAASLYGAKTPSRRRASRRTLRKITPSARRRPHRRDKPGLPLHRRRHGAALFESETSRRARRCRTNCYNLQSHSPNALPFARATPRRTARAVVGQKRA